MILNLKEINISDINTPHIYAIKMIMKKNIIESVLFIISLEANTIVAIF